MGSPRRMDPTYGFGDLTASSSARRCRTFSAIKPRATCWASSSRFEAPAAQCPSIPRPPAAAPAKGPNFIDSGILLRPLSASRVRPFLAMSLKGANPASPSARRAARRPPTPPTPAPSPAEAPAPSRPSRWDRERMSSPSARARDTLSTTSRGTHPSMPGRRSVYVPLPGSVKGVPGTRVQTGNASFVNFLNRMSRKL